MDVERKILSYFSLAIQLINFYLQHNKVMVTSYTPISVAYQLKNKIYVKTFTDLRCPDPLITNRSTKLPEGAEILQIGQGSSFYQEYKKKYKL